MEAPEYQAQEDEIVDSFHTSSTPKRKIRKQKILN